MQRQIRVPNPYTVSDSHRKSQIAIARRPEKKLKSPQSLDLKGLKYIYES